MKDVVGICCSERSDACLLDECDISLFLSRHDMADNKRDLGSDSFLNRRSASLADEDVVGSHQLWHLIRPSDEIASLVYASSRDGIVYGFSMTRDDSDKCICQSAQLMEGF